MAAAEQDLANAIDAFSESSRTARSKCDEQAAGIENLVDRENLARVCEEGQQNADRRIEAAQAEVAEFSKVRSQMNDAGRTLKGILIEVESEVAGRSFDSKVADSRSARLKEWRNLSRLLTVLSRLNATAR